MTNASKQRIKHFVDWFIRSEYAQSWTSDKDSDFVNEPERAARCYEAAEYGGDGKTHSEVIEDWREAFKAWIRDKRMWQEPERFIAGVEGYFDDLEMWHERNGSLFHVIG